MPAARRADQLRPRKRPVQARAQRTVDAVLKAAAELFLRRGYARTTTNHVAARAGVSIGSLYEYFPSKDAILVTLAEQHVDEAERVLAHASAEIAAAAPLSLAAIAHRIARAMIDLHARDHELHRIFFEETPLPRRIHQRIAAIETHATNELAALLTHHPEVAVPDPRVAAAIVVQTVEALTHRLVVHARAGVDLDAYVDEIVRLVVGYLSRTETHAAPADVNPGARSGGDGPSARRAATGLPARRRAP